MAISDLQDAFEALQREDVDEAIALLERTVNAVPAHLSAHVLLGRAYEVRKRWADALHCWAHARTLLPNSPVVHEGTKRVLRKITGSDRIPATPPREVDEPSPNAASAGPNASSDLKKLRRHAEEEARRGGARPRLSEALESSTEDADRVTPEDRIEALGLDASDEDDLDSLIRDLESARVEPDLDVEPAPEPELDEDVDEDLVSETLARIYESQEQYREAAEVYEKLATEEPDREDEFRRHAEEMREKAETDDE